MRSITIAVVVLIGLFFIGCQVKGQPMAYDQVCSLGNDKKTIETEGYLDDGVTVLCSNTGGRMECGLDLKKGPDSKARFSADIATGSGVNSMNDLPSGYKKSDIVIRNNDGNVIDLGKPVKITGKLSAYQSSDAAGGVGCFVQVYKIEQ